MFLIVSSALVANSATWFELFSSTCRAAWAPIAAAIVLMFGQVQSMHKLSYMSLVAFLMILIPVLIVIGEIHAMVGSGELVPGATVMFGDSPRKAIVAFTDIFFAFAGHVRAMCYLNH
jgi:hypothetical protein